MTCLMKKVAFQLVSWVSVNKDCSFAVIILQLDQVGGRGMGGVKFSFNLVHCVHFGSTTFLEILFRYPLGA